MVVVEVVFDVVEAVVTVVFDMLVDEVVSGQAEEGEGAFFPPQLQSSMTAAVSGSIYLNFISFLSV